MTENWESPTLSLRVALEIMTVTVTAYGVTSNDKFGIMTTVSFQWNDIVILYCCSRFLSLHNYLLLSQL